MFWPALMILGLVAVVVLVAVLMAKEPNANDGSVHLDRFLAEARQEQPTRETQPRPRKVSTTKPRQRPRQPQVLSLPLVPIETVIIIPVVKPEPDPEPRPPTPALPPQRPTAPAIQRLRRLLGDREGMQAAMLLQEILKPPRCRRTGKG